MFLSDVIRFCCILSLYMYHGLVTFLLIHCIASSIYIYIYDVYSSPYLTFIVSFLSLYTCFFLYTTCLCFTLDAFMNLV